MQEGYSALSTHYGFDAVFCNPAEGHEKGLVEDLVGWARRNICVPVPKVTDMQELNYELLARCLKYEKHKIRGKKATVGEMFQEEGSRGCGQNLGLPWAPKGAEKIWQIFYQCLI